MDFQISFYSTKMWCLGDLSTQEPTIWRFDPNTVSTQQTVCFDIFYCDILS
jgi:hypothetical protein